MLKKLGCLTKIIVFLILLLTIAYFMSGTKWFEKTIHPLHYKDIVIENADFFGLDSYLIFSVIRTESKFNKDAVSPKGAIGLMQLMPDTAEYLQRELGLNRIKEIDLKNPQSNIYLGTGYLTHLLNVNKGNLVLALAAYNAGPTTVSRWINDGIWDGDIGNVDKIPYKETREYVFKVIAAYEKYKELYQ